MSDGLLLDTCAAIWWTAGSFLLARARARIERAIRSGRTFVSPISAWEVASLAARGRSPTKISALSWYNRVLDLEGFQETAIDAEILTSSCEIAALSDPADRILVATARRLDLVLVTRDSRILAYGAGRHVRVMEC
jgi:PIN domain nuclease of toxin-antitoxin system